MSAPAPAPAAPATGEIRGLRLAAVGALTMAMLIPVTMPVAVLRSLIHDRFGVSELQTSLFMSVNMIGAVLTAPLVGAIANRLGSRKRLIVLGTVADAVLFVLLARADSFAVFMLLRFFEGAAHILALSALLGLLAESGRERGRLMGTAGAGITFGVGIGAPLGGVLGRSDPLVPLYVGAALLAVVAAVALLLLDEPHGRGGRPSLRQLARLVASNRALAVPYAYVFVDRFTTGFLTTTFSLFGARVFGLSPPGIGAMLACFLFPFSLLCYPAGRLAERRSPSGMMIAGSLVYGAGLATLGAWSVEGLPYLMVLLGSTAAVMFVPSLVLTSALAEPEMRDTALGGFNAAGALGFLIGPAVGGLVSQAIAARYGWPAGYSAAFAIAGVAEIVCVLLTAAYLARLRREGRIR